MNYIKAAADMWAVIAREEAEDALCMESWLTKLKERWAGFSKLRGLSERQQEEVLAVWCRLYFVRQDGELGRYLLARYILGDVGGIMSKGA